MELCSTVILGRVYIATNVSGGGGGAVVDYQLDQMIIGKQVSFSSGVAE